MLFVLRIDPFIRSICTDPKVRGLQLPGKSAITVSAYADDVSVFIRDRDRLLQVLRHFDKYGSISGAKLNMAKSCDLALGDQLRPGMPHNLKIAGKIRLLRVEFDRSGIASDVWEPLVQEVKNAAQRARLCYFSFAKKAYLVKCIFLAHFFYVAHVALPPRPVLQALSHAVFSFFWDGRTERQQIDALRLPRHLGGFSLPCIQTMAQLLGLKTLMAILDDVGAAARPLTMYFLGPLQMVLVSRALGNLYPSAEDTPQHYRAVISLFRELIGIDPEVEPRDASTPW